MPELGSVGYGCLEEIGRPSMVVAPVRLRRRAQQMASDAAIPARTASPAATLRNSSRDCSARTVVATSRYTRDMAAPRRLLFATRCCPQGFGHAGYTVHSLALSPRRSTCPRGRSRPAGVSAVQAVFPRSIHPFGKGEIHNLKWVAAPLEHVGTQLVDVLRPPCCLSGGGGRIGAVMKAATTSITFAFRRGLASPGNSGCTRSTSTSLSASPSPRADEPKAQAYRGFGLHPLSSFRIRRQSSIRRSAMVVAMGAASCSRYSSCRRRSQGGDVFIDGPNTARVTLGVRQNLAEGWRKRRYEAAFTAKLSDSEGEAAKTPGWLPFRREVRVHGSGTRNVFVSEL